jgi:twinkle protein
MSWTSTITTPSLAYLSGKFLRPSAKELMISRTFTKQLDLLPYPAMSLPGMKKFLRIKSVDFSETHPCLVIQLPKYTMSEVWDVETNWAKVDDSLSKVFINKTTGRFVCPQMALHGTWGDLEAVISAWVKNKSRKKSEPKVQYPTVRPMDISFPKLAKQLWDASVPIESLTSQEFKDVLKHFRQIKRDFDVKHFVHYETRVTEDHKSLLFPIKYINGKTIGLRRVFIDDDNLVAEEQVADSADPSLPLHHGLSDAVQSGTGVCVLVPSVLDSVVLAARTQLHPITLADWSTLHPDTLPYLDQFHTVYLWLDCDSNGVQVARQFARKIDEKRCRVVTEHPAALACVRKKIDVKEVLEKSRDFHHEFITTFDNLRHDVFREFANFEELQGVKWKRFEQLNSTMKGFRRAELTVFSGKTGSGKTTFMSEYSLDLCMQGVNTLWGSFEVGNVRLLRTMMKQFSLVDLEEDLSQFDHWADKFSKLPLYFTTFHGAHDVAKVMDTMSHAVYVHDIRHIIIDNMQFMMGSGGGAAFDKFLHQDQVIQKFRKFATTQDCHVTLVIHPRKEDEALTVHSIYGGAKATQEADNVLLLQDEFVQNSFQKKKYIQIVKNRFSGDLGILPLNFVKPLLSFSKKANQVKRARMKKELKLVSDTPGLEGTKEVLIRPDDS